MEFKKKITEKYKLISGISDIVYHFTSIPNAAQILNDDEFALTFISGSDDIHKSKSKFYYLSTTRSKVGSYHVDHAGYFGVLLKLNGTKLRQSHVGNPVDYWGREFRKVAPSKNEMEDRIWSEKPFIKPASKYIEEIHVYFGTKERTDDQQKMWLKVLVAEANKRTIPFYIYTDKNAARLLDKRKATDPGELSLETVKDPEASQYGKRDYMTVWLELYEKDNKDDLSTEPFGGAKRVASNIYRIDNISTFEADVHNSKKGSPSLHKIVEIMKKNKWNATDFYKYLQKKWN